MPADCAIQSMKFNQRKLTMSANLEKIDQHRRHLLGAAV
jgi:hypothetical protein